MKKQYNKFQIGDIVKVRMDYEDRDAHAGELLTFIKEDNTVCPRFQKADGTTLYFNNHDAELVNSEPTYNIF
jgi:hypothetical protein